MSTITVSTTTALLKAVNAAKGGDTILLAPGDYAGVNINNIHADVPINISSQNDANPAIITSLFVQNSSGLNFSQLTLSSAGATRTAPFEVSKSSNVNFSNIFNHGSLDGNPANDVSGLLFENSQNISVTNSTFKELMNGLGDLNNVSVNFSGNNFSEMGSDGIDNGGSSNVVISGNTFTDFKPVAGAHPDAIQFWTSNTTTSAHDISITGNSMVQGSGGEFQGVFFQDEVGNIPFLNVNITDNNIIGGAWNGIAVQGAANINITGNDLTSVVPTDASTSALSRILLESVSSGNVTNNVAAQYSFYASDANISTSANTTNSYLTSSKSTLVALAPVMQLAEHTTISGSIAISDTPGWAAAVTMSRSNNVTSIGTTITGTYGHLTLHADGQYSYSANKDGLVVGQTYQDEFQTTVTDNHGQTTKVDLEFNVVGSGTGDSSNNTIYGGASSELITGLGGADNLYSGIGKDTFVYKTVSDSTPNSFDVIHGFKMGDMIDLSSVDPNFTIVSSFNHQPNELILKSEGGGVWDVLGDTNGSGVADFQIHLVGVTTNLSGSSFHL
jgi:VCBS repeat-containing protein